VSNAHPTKLTEDAAKKSTASFKVAINTSILHGCCRKTDLPVPWTEQPSNGVRLGAMVSSSYSNPSLIENGRQVVGVDIPSGESGRALPKPFLG